MAEATRRPPARPCSAVATAGAKGSHRSALRSSLTPTPCTRRVTALVATAAEGLGGKGTPVNLRPEARQSLDAFEAALKGGSVTRRAGSHGVPRINEFTKLVGRTMDSMHKALGDVQQDTMQKTLTDLRKQYDDVHREADKREAELQSLCRDIRLLEVETEGRPNETAALATKLSEVSTEIAEATETRKVYEHMVSRLTRECRIVQQKVSIMQDYLERKTHEVAKRQDCSRRVHQEKIQTAKKLEAMEQEVDMERDLAGAAIRDLDEATLGRHYEVWHWEEFERWRYDVALEAANEAFQVTLGKYLKIYAVEKLTGNCLQKIAFQQAEQSQATEDGFQKIRQVTGLTEVSDIVQKFLNRDIEHEQLQSSVREAEARLQKLREAEAARRTQDAALDMLDTSDAPRGFHASVADHEQQLAKAQRDNEEFQRRLQQGALVVDSITRWTQKMTRSLAPFEELTPAEFPVDIGPYFDALAQTLDRFLTHARSVVPDLKLTKLASQVSNKEHAEQQRLLNDRDFITANCRVPVHTEPRVPETPSRKARHGPAQEEERQELEFAIERERLKLESSKKVGERDAHHSRERRGGEGRDGRRRRRDGGEGEVRSGEHAVAVTPVPATKEGEEPGPASPSGSGPANGGASAGGPRPPSRQDRTRPPSSASGGLRPASARGDAKRKVERPPQR